MKAHKRKKVDESSELSQDAYEESTKGRHILEAFEHIVILAKDSDLSPDFYEVANEHIRYAARRLKLSPLETVFLALFVDRSEDDRIRMSEIANYIGCRTTKLLRISTAIDKLEEAHYLRASRCHNSLSYRVPMEVLKALKQNQPYVYYAEPITDVKVFFDRFDRWMNEVNDNEITHDALLALTKDGLEQIAYTYFVRTLNGFGLDEEDRLLFIFMAHLFVENNDDCIGFHDIDDIYDNRTVPSWRKVQLRKRECDLFSHGLIENAFEDGMARSDAYKLTEFAKSDLLSELELSCKATLNQNLIKPDSFPEKSLIYNLTEQSQIDQLASILSADRFKTVQDRLVEAGLRKGFCILFYGSPGTGKTETVYQLARATGREIMRVDVDRIKSCWVGESEQNMKKLFEQYRKICESSSIKPILLFNEADAVLGTRMEGAIRAVDKMENALQNIILQEMETFGGIMIATTNLTSNLDKAFERRFLYKVQFCRPTLEAQIKIWQVMLPQMTERDAKTLASKFSFSGGEIENISRKYTVSAILSGKEAIDMSMMMEFCQNERISKQGHTKIGYVF